MTSMNEAITKVMGSGVNPDVQIARAARNILGDLERFTLTMFTESHIPEVTAALAPHADKLREIIADLNKLAGKV